jgi:hypothetical protein
VTEKAARQSSTKTETTENPVNPMVKTQAKIRQTYQEYIDAQTDFENAFKEREKEDQLAHKESEKKYKVYEIALETAFKHRETAEQRALDDYQKTVENTRAIYAEAMNTALADCKKATEQARNLLIGISVNETHPTAPVWFTLHVKKPNYKTVKFAMLKIRHWAIQKKAILAHKMQRTHKPFSTEVVEGQ